MDDISVRVTALENGFQKMTDQLSNVENRLKTVEVIGQDVTSILSALNKLAKQLKIWAPTVVGAAISAGIVNGKIGLFLHALFNGAS